MVAENQISLNLRDLIFCQSWSVPWFGACPAAKTSLSIQAKETRQDRRNCSFQQQCCKQQLKTPVEQGPKDLNSHSWKESRFTPNQRQSESQCGLKCRCDLSQTRLQHQNINLMGNQYILPRIHLYNTSIKLILFHKAVRSFCAPEELENILNISFLQAA